MSEVSTSELSTAQDTRPSTAGKELVDLWNDSRLRTAEAKSSSVRPAPRLVPWHAALEDILKVGYGVQTQPRFISGAWQRVRWRTTPSAGALYPFEVIVGIVGEGSYLWDIEGRLVPCSVPAPTQEDLAAAGFVTTAGHNLEAVLILVARPWLSMRKYHRRGYSYCHLDIGHTATNLAIYTSALGLTPTVHLRFSHTALAEQLKLDGLCREPLAVLSFASPEPPPVGLETADLELVAGQEPACLELPGQLEIVNWESLRGVLSLDCALQAPCAPSVSTLLLEPPEMPEESLLPLPAGRPLPSAATEWRSAILGRRSAKGFRNEPVSVAQIGELLSALRVPGLPADCAPEASARLGVRLVARNVEGIAGVFAYTPRSHALQRIDEHAGDPRPACMQQEIAGDAAALVIFHAPICRLVDQQGYSAFAELHFHAAQLGQRLHLAASRLGAVGITCIGGFDDEQCAALARLDAGDEAVYVILLGIPNDAAFKHDRLSVAFSHGYTTLEG
jgi:SagB-type dehydrogenase family enzyme